MGFIIRRERTPGLANTAFFSRWYYYFLFCFFDFVVVFLLVCIFLTSGLEEQAAVMSRAPEDVSKLTESTYKVSDITCRARK